MYFIPFFILFLFTHISSLLVDYNAQNLLYQTNVDIFEEFNKKKSIDNNSNNFSNYELVFEKKLTSNDIIEFQLYELQNNFKNTTIPKKYKIILKNLTDKPQILSIKTTLEDSTNNNGGCPGDCIIYFFQKKNEHVMTPYQEKEILIEFDEEKVKKIYIDYALVGLVIDIKIFPNKSGEKISRYTLNASFLDNYFDKKGWIKPEYKYFDMGD